MKISVVIPCYKAFDYLWDCLHSIKKQDYPHSDFEIILVLNGEKEPYFSDISHFLCSEFDGSFSIRLLYSEWANVSNARNIGIDNAQGDFITFIDDDDYVSESFLSSLYRCSSSSVIGIAHPRAFNDEGVVSYSLERKFKQLKKSQAFSFKQAFPFFQGPCMKLIHRGIIGNRRFNTAFKNGEDSLFMFQISDRFSQVCLTSEDAIYHRRIRTDGANYSKKSVKYYLRNSYKLIIHYSYIYLHKPLKYSFFFYLTRVLGAVKTCLLMK